MYSVMWFNKCKAAVVILLTLLVAVVYSSSAQKTKIPKEQFVNITMAKFPVADFPEHSIAVSGVTVLQQMSDSIRFGFTNAGKDNAVASLTFAKPLREVFQTQIDRMYRHEYRKNGTQILFVLRKLRYASRISTATYQYTKFCADAYVIKKENSYQKVCSIDTILLVINGGNIGSSFENALRVLMRQTLFNLKDLPNQDSIESNLNEIAGPKPVINTPPILNDTSFTEGLYLSFEDFLANKPYVTDFEVIENGKTNIKVIAAGTKTSKDTLEIWGLCKSDKLFKQYEGMLVPIVKNNENFVLVNYDYYKRGDGLPYYKKLNAGMGRLNEFSLVPIAFDIINLLSRSREPKPILVKSIPHIADEEKLPFATSVDMQTGEFIF